MHGCSGSLLDTARIALTYADGGCCDELVELEPATVSLAEIFDVRSFENTLVLVTTTS